MKKNIKQKTPIFACLLALSLVGAGCSQESAIFEASTKKPSKPLVKNVEVTVPEVKASAAVSLQQNIASAKADLALRLSVDEAGVELMQVRSVTWGSSAIGCPEADTNYTQAVVPGTLLLLKGMDAVHRYHGREGGDLFYCSKERAKAPAYGHGNELM
jgi:hypothetical protein